MQATAGSRLLVLCALLCACSTNRQTSEPVRASASPADGHADGQTAEQAAGARVVLTPPNGQPVVINVEVARTDQERQRGLMYRMQMEEDAGMLFLFEKPDQLTFWMHNTYIPLDMVFIEPSLHILGIVENAAPRNDSPRAVPGQSQYVLEVNAGFSKRHGVTDKTVVRFEGVQLLPTNGSSK
jgi:hypothetical protein